MSIFDKMFRRGGKDEDNPEEDTRERESAANTPTPNATPAPDSGPHSYADEPTRDEPTRDEPTRPAPPGERDEEIREDTIPGMTLPGENTPTPQPIPRTPSRPAARLSPSTRRSVAAGPDVERSPTPVPPAPPGPPSRPPSSRPQSSRPLSSPRPARVPSHGPASNGRAHTVARVRAPVVSDERTVPRGSKPRAATGRPGGPNKPNRRIPMDTSDISGILEEFDDAASVHTQGALPAAGTANSATDKESLRQLFEELAGHHMEPVRNLLIEVKGGRARAEWIDHAMPAAKSVRDMAEQIELVDLTRALSQLLDSFDSAKRAGPVVSDAARKDILEVHTRLRELLPGALELDEEKRRREPVIVRALLGQVHGIGKLEMDKLGAAGLLTIDKLAGAKANEVHAVTGIDAEICTRLVERIDTYFAKGGSLACIDLAAEQDNLAALLEALRKHNQSYDQAAKQWTDEAKEARRQARAQRAETLLRIHVSLARQGQLDSLVELDRMPFRRKIQFIESYLSRTRAAAAAGRG